MKPFRHTLIFLQFSALFLLFNPFLLMPLSLPFDTYELQRVLEWIVIALSLFHLCVDRPVRLHSFGFLQSLCSYKKILLGLIFVLGLISSLHAVYPAYALMEFSTFCGLFFTVMLFTGLFCQDKESYTRYFYAFILITVGVSCLTALLMLFYDLTIPGFDTGGDAIYTTLASPGYMNRRFYDDVACMVLPILIALSYRQEKKTHINWLIFIMLAYMYTRGIVSHSRIYLVEPLALFMLFPFFYKRKAIPFLMIQLAAIVLGAILYVLFYMHHHIMPGVFPDRTFLNHRHLLWAIALGLMLHHPLLGVGPLHFNWYAFPFEATAAHPHSAIMVIGSEWGLPVLLAVTILTVSGIIACIKNRAVMSMGLMGSLIGAFFMMQVDGLILMPAGQSMLCLILAWACASQSAGATQITQVALSRWLSPILLSLGLIAFLTMLGVGLPLLMQMDSLMLNFLTQCHNECVLSPNYWSQGFIQYYPPML